jgi:GMP synthase (glutamine-hydrolysing)
LKEDKPVLGICYGHQLLATALGGAVGKGAKGEYGSATLEVLADDPLFSGTPRIQKVWMSHRDYVEKLPPGSLVLARTEDCEIAAFRLAGAGVYGVQFHPEVKHTEYGARILENFLRGIAGLEPSWRPEDAVKNIIERVRAAYKGGNILVAASGGVDSTTAAYIVKLAVGSEPIHLVVIDTGLLREEEAERAVSTLRSLGFKHVHLVDASREFLGALKGVVDPEEKRRVIARVYFEVLERKAKELSAVLRRVQVPRPGDDIPR